MTNQPKVYDFIVRLTMEEFEQHKETLEAIDDSFCMDALTVMSDEPGGYAQFHEGPYITEALQEELDVNDLTYELKPWDDMTFDQKIHLLTLAANAESFVSDSTFESYNAEQLELYLTADYFITEPLQESKD